MSPFVFLLAVAKETFVRSRTTFYTMYHRYGDNRSSHCMACLPEHGNSNRLTFSSGAITFCPFPKKWKSICGPRRQRREGRQSMAGRRRGVPLGLSLAIGQRDCQRSRLKQGLTRQAENAITEKLRRRRGRCYLHRSEGSICFVRNRDLEGGKKR